MSFFVEHARNRLFIKSLSLLFIFVHFTLERRLIDALFVPLSDGTI
jgi:hypothetical protein